MSGTGEVYQPNQPRIADRCPTCGWQSLFIGAGGWLTCSVIGCKRPALQQGIEDLRSAAGGPVLNDGRGGPQNPPQATTHTARARRWLGKPPHLGGHGWTAYSDCEACVGSLAVEFARVELETIAVARFERYALMERAVLTAWAQPVGAVAKQVAARILAELDAEEAQTP